MEAGAYWVSGSAKKDDNRELVAQMKSLGAPEHLIREQENWQDDFGVWEENWSALDMFLACQTQLRFSPDGTLIGLDYNAVKVVLEMNEKESTFVDIQMIESGALSKIRELRGG